MTTQSMTAWSRIPASMGHESPGSFIFPFPRRRNPLNIKGTGLEKPEKPRTETGQFPDTFRTVPGQFPGHFPDTPFRACGVLRFEGPEPYRILFHLKEQSAVAAQERHALRGSAPPDPADHTPPEMKKK